MILGRVNATAASALHFLMPPLGLLFGWLVLRESVSWLDLLGIVPIAFGIWLATRHAWVVPAQRGETQNCLKNLARRRAPCRR